MIMNVFFFRNQFFTTQKIPPAWVKLCYFCSHSLFLFFLSPFWAKSSLTMQKQIMTNISLKKWHRHTFTKNNEQLSIIEKDNSFPSSDLSLLNYMGVSVEIRVLLPQIIPFYLGVFHYKPSIFRGYVSFRGGMFQGGFSPLICGIPGISPSRWLPRHRSCVSKAGWAPATCLGRSRSDRFIHTYFYTHKYRYK